MNYERIDMVVTRFSDEGGDAKGILDFYTSDWDRNNVGLKVDIEHLLDANPTDGELRRTLREHTQGPILDVMPYRAFLDEMLDEILRRQLHSTSD